MDEVAKTELKPIERLVGTLSEIRSQFVKSEKTSIKSAGDLRKLFAETLVASLDTTSLQKVIFSDNRDPRGLGLKQQLAKLAGVFCEIRVDINSKLSNQEAKGLLMQVLGAVEGYNSCVPLNEQIMTRSNYGNVGIDTSLPLRTIFLGSKSEAVVEALNGLSVELPKSEWVRL